MSRVNSAIRPSPAMVDISMESCTHEGGLWLGCFWFHCLYQKCGVEEEYKSGAGFEHIFKPESILCQLVLQPKEKFYSCHNAICETSLTRPARWQATHRLICQIWIIEESGGVLWQRERSIRLERSTRLLSTIRRSSNFWLGWFGLQQSWAGCQIGVPATSEGGLRLHQHLGLSIATSGTQRHQKFVMRNKTYIIKVLCKI